MMDVDIPSGTIPVVVGPPNIEEFSPGPGSILFIKELSDVESVAKTMKKLADNPEAYNQSLRYVCSLLIETLIFQILLFMLKRKMRAITVICFWGYVVVLLFSKFVSL